MNVNEHLNKIVEWIEWAANEITNNNKVSESSKEKFAPILNRCEQLKNSLDQIDSNLDNLDKVVNFNKANDQQDENKNKQKLIENNIGVFNAQSLNDKLQEIKTFLKQNKDNILDEDAKEKITKIGNLITIDLKTLIDEQTKIIKENEDNIDLLEKQVDKNESKLNVIKTKSILIGATASTGIIALLVLSVKVFKKFKKSSR